MPHFQEESVATLIFPSRITRCRVSFGGQSDGIRHMVQVTLVRSRMQDGSTAMCGLGIRFREDGEGRLHVEHLIEGGAGKTSRALQIGDTLKELDGATMQASVCRPGGCLPCTRGDEPPASSDQRSAVDEVVSC